MALLNTITAKNRLSKLISYLQAEEKTAAFARRLEVSRTAVNQWKGKTVGSVESENLAKIAAFSGRTVDQLTAYINGEISLEDYLEGKEALILSAEQLVRELCKRPLDERLSIIGRAIEASTNEAKKIKKVHSMSGNNRLTQFIQQWLIDKGVSKEELQRRLFEEEELEPEIFEQIFSGELTPDEDQLGAIAGVMRTGMEWDEWLELIGNRVVDAPTEVESPEETADDNHLIGNGN